ncbi:MAG TPA: SRPBCC family protein, partial [Rudaea sp.]|nr:SRPBCC family protein [Rudaea sp.]
MKMISALAFALSLLASGTSMAAAPPLHVAKSVTIDADAGKVWDIVKNFDGLNTWHPAVAKDEIVSGTNNKAGAVRLLTLKDGGTIKEKLLAYNDQARTFKYAILEGVLPVSSYTSTFIVKSAGKGKATVTWSGNFKRKNVGDKPADNENDKTATDTISGVY